MDAVNQYREVVERVLAEYARIKPSHGTIETEMIVDAGRNHFEVLHIGWDGDRRVHGAILHVDIIGDKVWVQHDGTNRPVAEELVRAGIPRSSIVLGFHPPYVRALTDFAAA